jgi:hypothetical protein
MDETTRHFCRVFERANNERRYMIQSKANERRLLQAVVLILAAIPVAIGLAGIIGGPAFLGVERPWPVDLDSHFRFLSGTFLALGIAWYSCVPGIERNTGRFQLLAALTFAGGLGRLISLLVSGAPSSGHRVGLLIELIVVPVLVFWQARIAGKG